MAYKDLTKEKLLERISELEALNKELIDHREKEETLEFAWSGNLGHWFWNVRTNSVEFNPLKVTTLGYERSEIPDHVTYQFFTDLIHPDDFLKTMDAMKEHLYGRAAVYEAEYRIKAKDGRYKWYYDRGKITQYDDSGKPAFLAGIVFDITEKKEMQLELERKNKILAEMSSLDGLTRISNHRTLTEHLKAESSMSDMTGRALSVAIFDIDDFKRVNDSKGHIIGDRVLIEIADIIKFNIRDNDLTGRYGGEEFMVVFANTEIDAAYHAAERIRKAVESHRFPEELRVTISGGVSQYSGEDISAFIHSADTNLYEAKRKGKNRIVM